MIPFVCQCRASYSLPDHLGGKQVRCKQCGKTSRVATEPVYEIAPAAPLDPPDVALDMGAIHNALLISAISNIAIGVILLSFCVGVLWLVAGIAEVIYFSQASRAATPENLKGRRAWGVGMIVFGLINWFTLVCGIVVVVKSNELLRRINVGY